MSNVEPELLEQFQWFRRPPIWWDPVPDWLDLRMDIRHKLLMVEMQATREMLDVQMRAFDQKMELLEQALG
jgi:hypothetical protein